MATSKAAAGGDQNQAEAPEEVEDQTSNESAANLESDGTAWGDVEDDGKPLKAEESDDDSQEDDNTDEFSTEDFDDDTDEGEAEEDNEEEQPDEEAEKADESGSEESQQQLTEDEIKERNRQAAETRINAKKEREATLEAKQKEYVEAADSDEEAHRRAVDVELYNSRVERNTNTLVGATKSVFADFPVLSDKDPAIRRRVARAIDAFEAKHVKIDVFGNPSKVSGDLYQYLKEEAESITELTGKGARQQIDNKAKEKRKTFTRPVRKPTTSKKDPMLEAFEQEASR